MKGYVKDTIVAISTPIGESGIGIVRMSGKDSLAIAQRIFCPVGGAAGKTLRNYRVHYGHIINPFENRIIDEVIVLVMKAPHSYTREDVVEIQCHGGVIPLMRILELVIKCGARVALPGEFTKRAFINGRIDLIQAEAVIDMVRSKSEKACEIAFEQLSGRVSEELKFYRERLIQLIASVEATIDFPEEEIPFLTDEELLCRVRKLREELEQIVERSKSGKLYRDGIRIAIVGKPNVGKSSLLNALLSEKRAIVTEYPGTTRDCIAEWFNLRGIPVILTDTAGIRQTGDCIERAGMQKTMEAVDNASFIIVVMDISEDFSFEDRNILDMVKEKGKNYIVALNKFDLIDAGEKIGKGMEEVSGDTVRISALRDVGIIEIEDMIYERVWQGDVLCGNRCVISNTRHRESLINAIEALKRAEETLITGGIPEDVILIDLRKSLSFIAGIFGENFDEDVLDKIFSDFCIGK